MVGAIIALEFRLLESLWPSLTFHLALISHPSHCDKSESSTILSKSEVLRNK